MGVRGVGGGADVSERTTTGGSRPFIRQSLFCCFVINLTNAHHLKNIKEQKDIILGIIGIILL